MTEAKIQSDIVSYFNKNYRQIGILAHVPNHRFNNCVALGQVKGFPDLVLILKDKTIFIELKNEKGRLSNYQLKIKEKLELLNQEWYLVRSLEDFKKIIERYV